MHILFYSLKAKVCDFVIDCPAEDDERDCPAYELFDECTSLSECHWTEEKVDNFDFIIKPVSDLNEGAYIHGPHTDPVNSTDGNVVFLLNQDQDSSDMTQYQASILSPIHRNSMASCYVEFWYYIAGDIGQNGALIPMLLNKNGLNQEIYLDRLVPDSPGVGAWRKSINGIGRQREDFQMRLKLEPKQVFDAGLAIDDFGFVNCAQPPPIDDCPEPSFQCIETKACVTADKLCDLTDDCGDMSDEELERCSLRKRETFENDDTPLGLFTQNSEYADFEWERGSGMEGGAFVTGPPFDHTTFGPEGHYLFIRSSEHNQDEKAQLVTKPFQGNREGSEPCTLTLWYYMYGSGVGNLTLYLQ